MKTKYVNLIGILLLLIVSCNEPMPELPEKYKLKDSRYTKIEGQVLEYGTNKPLSYASVILQEAIYERGSGGGNYISIDTIQADAEGKYYLEFKHESNTSTYNVDYKIYCEEFWYFPDDYDMEVGYGYRRNLVLDPYSWIRVHVKNVNPNNEFDEVFVTSGGGAICIYW